MTSCLRDIGALQARKTVRLRAKLRGQSEKAGEPLGSVSLWVESEGSPLLLVVEDVTFRSPVAVLPPHCEAHLCLEL